VVIYVEQVYDRIKHHIKIKTYLSTNERMNMFTHSNHASNLSYYPCSPAIYAQEVSFGNHIEISMA